MRIEVGYGLEGVLPDGLAGEVIRDQFTPKFKSNDYSGGIKDGVDRLVQIVEKHQVLTPEELAKFNQGSGGDKVLPFIVIPFFGLFVTIGFTMLGLGLRSKAGFPVLFGSMFGGIPMLMSMAIIGKLALLTLVPWGVLMFLNGYRLGGKPGWRDAFREDGGGGTGKGGKSGGWTMGTSRRSSSGSSSSSSSSSGSSSSFGGGSSGGGGASGRW
jgi:uncharacterized protein